MRSALLATLLTLGPATWSPCRVAAASPARCSCVVGDDPQLSRAFSAAVFLGVADSVSISSEHAAGESGPFPGVQVRFHVLAAWSSGPRPKVPGEPDSLAGMRYPALPDSITILGTGHGAGDCGYPFAVGETYLVYARYLGPRLYTTICSRTRLLAQAGADLRALGAPEVDRRAHGRERPKR